MERGESTVSCSSAVSERSFRSRNSRSKSPLRLEPSRSPYKWEPSSSEWPNMFRGSTVLLSPLSYAGYASPLPPMLARDFYQRSPRPSDLSRNLPRRKRRSPRSAPAVSPGRRVSESTVEESTNNVDEGEEGDEEEEEEEEEAGKAIGMFGMFAYADVVDKLLMLVGSIGALINGGALPLYSLFFGRMMNTVGRDSSRDELYRRTNQLCVYMTILSGFIAIGAYLEVACWMFAADRQAQRIRIKYLRAVLRQNIEFFDTALTTSEVMESISRDVSLIQEAIGDKMSGFLHYMGVFIVGYSVGFISCWQLALVVFAVTPLMLLTGKTQRAAFVGLASKEQESYYEAGRLARESISSIRTVQSFGALDRISSKFNELLKKSVPYGIKAGFVRGGGIGVIYLVVYSTWALSLWYGSLLVANKKSSPGQVFACLFGVITGGRGIGNAIPYLANIAQGGVAAYRVFRVIDRIPPIDSEDPHGQVPRKIKGEIAFHKVKFSYPVNPSRPVLRSFSLSVPAGETVALVGPSGCGKSTLFSLVERFYDPQSGSISLDGIDIRDIQLRWLRERIGLVGQEPILYATTLAENIRYGRQGAKMEEVISASKAAHAHSFISKFPDGYETQVGESGTQLSGGQKQRIAIARAIIRNPRILLLDEATSALDTESERKVQAALEKLMRRRTTMVIAHRLSTIEHAKAIAVVSDGEVVEKGSHKELMSRQSGLYRSLVEASATGGGDGNPPIGGLKVREESSEYMASPDLNFLTFGETNADKGRRSSDEKDVAKSVPFSRIVEFSRKDWLFLVFGALNSIHAGLILPLYAWTMGQLAGEYFSSNMNKLKHNSANWSLFFVALGIGAIFFMAGQHGLINWAGVRLTSRLRRQVFKEILSKPITWFEQKESAITTAGILSYLSEDCSAVRGALGDKLLVWTMACAAFGVGFVICATLQWKMTILAVVLTPMFFAASYIQTFLQAGILSTMTDKVYARASGIVLEAVSNIRTVAAFCAEGRVEQSFRDCVKESVRSSVKRAQVIGIISALSQGLMYCSYTVTLWFGGILIHRGDAKFQQVLQVFLIFVLSSYSLGQLTSMAPDSKRSQRAVESVVELLDGGKDSNFESENGGRKKPGKRSSCKGRIEFDGVQFSYPSRPEVRVLRGVTFTVKPFTSLALVGGSGCGKSTIISLLQRFYDPDGGFILLDGKSVADLDTEWLRSQMGVVSQEPALFSATIEENIALGLKSWKSSEIEQAARSADAHRFITGLPKGYQTFIGEGGIQLSGGQKQRIAIARAIVRNPRILLLDEATSALDSQSEGEIQRALSKAMERRTSVMVAHRLCSIKGADSIAVLRNGVVVETGSHEKLMLNPHGPYFALLNSMKST